MGFGVTRATGGERDSHDLLAWNFRNGVCSVLRRAPIQPGFEVAVRNPAAVGKIHSQSLQVQIGATGRQQIGLTVHAHGGERYHKMVAFFTEIKNETGRRQMADNTGDMAQKYHAADWPPLPPGYGGIQPGGSE